MYTNIASCINAIAETNIFREICIYFSKIKARKGFSFTINELIIPLEESMKFYINFNKKITNFTPCDIIKIRNILIETKYDEELNNRMKKLYPLLFTDITQDEFIDTFEKFNERIKKFEKNANKERLKAAQMCSLVNMGKIY